jgi:hypothetical protein
MQETKGAEDVALATSSTTYRNHGVTRFVGDDLDVAVDSKGKLALLPFEVAWVGPVISDAAHDTLSRREVHGKHPLDERDERQGFHRTTLRSS